MGSGRMGYFLSPAFAALHTVAAVAATIIVTLTPSALSAGGLAPPTATAPALTTTSTAPIGRVAWSIQDVATSKVIGTGDRSFTANEVQVIYNPKKDYLEQRLPLSDGFYLKLNSGRDKEPFTGFGMAAGKSDQMTFSWEWFLVPHASVGPETTGTIKAKAKKLQEKGEVEIEMMKLGPSYEIIRTQFLTDVSMRIEDMEREDAEVKDGPTWRVNVLKDSEVRWPTVAGTKAGTPEEAAEWHRQNPPTPDFWSSLIKAASE